MVTPQSADGAKIGAIRAIYAIGITVNGGTPARST
jgi:hypothetical protein